MPNLGSYCFKPKYGPEISKKIIEHFCNKFLSYDHEGFYLYWREHDPKTTYKPVPKGWLEFYIDTDGGNMEAFTETCFWDDEANVDGRDLTEYFFAMLGEDFWGADVDGNLNYSMYERELFEVVQAISAEDARCISWEGDRMAYVSYTDSKGERRVKHLDLLEHVINVEVTEEKDERQLTLAFA